jgi:hypothetical protein
VSGGPLRFVVACECLVLFGLVGLQPAIRNSLAYLGTAGRLALRGDLTQSPGRLAPHAGEIALSPLPEELVTIARQQRMGDFSLSPGLSSRADILLRVTEGAWPIQLTARSHNLFVATGESLPPACERRHRGQFVDYVRCG